MDKLHFIKDETQGKRVLILGFGKEGQAAYHYLTRNVPGINISIADSNENAAPGFTFAKSVPLYWGPLYLRSVQEADIIVKSPGIPLKSIPEIHHKKVTSQTEWFIRGYRNQIVGITGTKGKSTTSSLLFHIFRESGIKSLLIGNIGTPALSVIDQIEEDTLVVYELSCHQLQEIQYSPSSAILLNIFQEHLDHYNNLEEYQLAKIQIALHQHPSDHFIYHSDDITIKTLLSRNKVRSDVYPFSMKNKRNNSIYVEQNSIVFNYKEKEHLLVDDIYDIPLLGDHNILNIMAASGQAFLKGVAVKGINRAVHSFQPLEHRLEYMGVYRGISFYNDSISTIPESTVQAIKTLKDVHTLIVGGFDRGIDFTVLVDYLFISTVKLIIATGDAGARIALELQHKGIIPFEIITADDYQQVVSLALQKTPSGKMCLLSPAAASYDWFKNFEERGNIFKSLVKNSSKAIL
jgi:UDP-N-acetylmuramoylalanine--D-glutamate ligase